MNKIDLVLDKPLFIRSIEDDYKLDISPLLIGYEMCEKNKPEINLKKNFFVLHYVISGKGYVEYEDGIRQQVSSGQCFIYTPDSHLKYAPDKDNPWFYFWIEITGNSVYKIFSDFSNSYQNKIIPVKNKKLFEKTIIKLFTTSYYATSVKAEMIRTTGLINELFSFLLDETLILRKEKVSLKKEEQIKSIIRYVNSNYSSSEISVQSIAEKFFYNPSYLSRNFREQTGISLIKYIITMRMRRAVELLENGSFSISQIAYSLGYKNQFYFSKEFKKFYGIPPTKYLTERNKITDDH